ncbi:hypothetical protein SDC9_105339 [bioreactor metagenome]|uniref:Uncharacterized protein n=1 Tax=bioreactor metagenome TaxID=1076179 RepID=A0A645B0D9_9ZZZZ
MIATAINIENIITGIIFALAISFIGLSGIISIKTAENFGISLALKAVSFTNSIPAPKSIALPTIRPIAVAKTVVAIKNPTDFKLILFSLVVLSKVVMLEIKDDITSGITSILIKLT